VRRGYTVRDRIVSGDAVRKLRIKLKMRQEDLARAARLSESFIKYVEGNKCQPRDYNAEKIAAALHCNVEDFSTPKPADVSGSAA